MRCGINAGQDVDEVKAFAFALQIGSEGGVETDVVITKDNGEPRVDRAEGIEDRFLADIAQVPDFIDAFEELFDLRNPAVMGVGNDSDPVSLLLRHKTTSLTKCVILATSSCSYGSTVE